MKRLISFLLTAIMCINLTSIALADEPEFIVDKTCLGGYMPIVNLGIIETDDVTEYAEPNVMALSLEPDWVNNGGRYYYNYLATLDNGENLQGFYDKLYRNMKRYIYDYSAKTSYISELSDNFLCIDVTEYYDSSVAWETMTETYHKVYNALLQDNPQFFYVDLGAAMVTGSGKMFYAIQIADEYLDASARIAEADAITAGVDEYDAVINMDMTNYAIEKKVHDKLILNNNYAKDANGDPLDTRYAHSIAGSLNGKYGGGVCESYAKAFQLLLNRYNVPCYFITGYAGAEAHAWNCVQLDDGDYYCVDVTWDDATITVKENEDDPGINVHGLRYEYFNMPNTDFYSERNKTLTYYAEALPVCSDSKAYYSSDFNVFIKIDENDNYLFKAPDVNETGTRATTTTTETTTETTTSKVYEYSTEATTSAFQMIASDSIKKDFVVSSDNAGALAQFSDKTYLAFAQNNTVDISIILDEACYVKFTHQTNSGYTIVYIDDEPQGMYDGNYIYSLNVPQGQHKLSWKLYSPSSDYTMLYDINVISMGDHNLDGEVDLTDAIGLLKADSVPIDTYYYMDTNNDGAVNGIDAAYILKRSAEII